MWKYVESVKICWKMWKCAFMCENVWFYVFLITKQCVASMHAEIMKKHEWIREGKIIRSSLLWSCITDMHSIDCTVCNMCSLIALMDQRMWRLLAFGVIWIRIFLDGGGLGEHRCRSLSSRRSFQRSCSDHGMDMKRWSWKCLFSKKHSTTNC